jgi:hypothetical protein
MKKIMLVLCVLISTISFGQTDAVRITWLGIDFSQVKLIGDFSQFAGWGHKSSGQIKERYFYSWNALILNERQKYDIKGMTRKSEIFYDIDMIAKLNDSVSLNSLQAYNNPHYTPEDIKQFVSKYDFKNKPV